MQPTDTFAPYKNKRSSLLTAGVVIALIIIGAIIATVIIGRRGGNPTAAVIQITPSGFVPETITVKPNTIITWKNTDTAPHKVSSNPYPTNDGTPGLNSPSLLPGSGYTYQVQDSNKTITFHDGSDPTHNGTIRVTQ